MKIESNYLSNYCRLCFEKNDYLINIFRVVQSEQIIYKIEFCTGIKIPRHDNMLKEICLPCLNLLDSAYYFKVTCLKSNSIYNQILNAYVTIRNHMERHKVASSQLKTEENLIRYYSEDCTSKVVKEELVNLHLKEEKNIGCNYEVIMNQYDINYDNSINSGSISFDRGLNYKSQVDINPEITSCDSNKNLIKHKKFNESKRKSIKQHNKFVLPSSFTSKQTSLNNLKTEEDNCKIETKVTIYKCMECDFETQHKNWVMKHANTHKKARYNCATCALPLTSQARYVAHMRSHGTRSLFPCPICARSFACAQNLLQHRRLVHEDFTYSRPSYADKARSKEPKFRCRPCVMDFGSRSDRNKHYRSVHLKKGSSDKTGSNAQICDICGIRYKCADHRLRHFPPQFECDTCNKKFVTKNELATHIDFRHIGKTRWMCGACGKFARCKTSLATHYERRHRPGAGYRCHLCARALRTRHVFKQHLIAHRSPRSRHECKLCGSHRTRRNAMDLHMMKDHGMNTKGDKNSTFIAFYKYYLTEKDIKEIEDVYQEQVSVIEALYKRECIGGNKVYVLGELKDENKDDVKSEIDGKRVIDRFYGNDVKISKDISDSAVLV